MKVKVPPCTIGSRHPKVLWSKINSIINDHNDDHDHDENDYEDDGVEADKKYEHIHHQPVERSRFQTQREWCRVCSFEQGHPPCLVIIRRMR